MKELNVIFMGTADFAVPILEYLIKSTNVTLVVTQPDKEVGRDKVLSCSPIKKVAIENHIDVFQPIKIRENFEIISEINPDIIITCAYGQIIPKAILDIPKYGCINVHASLLPKYRGAAPIQWSLLNGEKETGVTLMYMDEHMDTGDMIARAVYEIKEADNVGTLHDNLSNIGAKLLKDNLPSIINGTNERTSQDETLATYAPMIKREDEMLNFNEPGEKVINKIRAFNPWPLAYFKLNNKDIKVIKAKFIPKNVSNANKLMNNKKEMLITCLDGYIKMEMIKPAGKKEMPASSYLNGINNFDEVVINEG